MQIGDHASVSLICQTRDWTRTGAGSSTALHAPRAFLMWETAKKVPHQLLVCGIGDLWRFWMVYFDPAWSEESLGHIYNQFGIIQVLEGSEFMGEMFQAAQWEIFDHRSLLQNIFLISAKLNFHRPMLRIVLYTRGRWKFSLVDIKKIFCRSDLWSKISHVLVVQLETFSP